MKSRESFFNKTVFYKDLTRFMWAWVAYCVVAFLQATGYIQAEGYLVMFLANELTRPLSTSLFALVVCLCLFGDLYDRRLCNGLHALPIRREAMLFSHLAAAAVFWLFPRLLQCSVFIPLLGKQWYAAAFWLLGTTVQYLFFLSVGVLAVLCAGRKISAVALYSLFNGIGTLAQWFASCYYGSVLTGIVFPEEPFYPFSPNTYFEFLELIRTSVVEDGMEFVYRYEGLGSGWWYVGVIGAVAVGLIALSVVAYRRRPLEAIGGLVVFRPLRAVISVILTLMAGTAGYAVAGLLGANALIGVAGLVLCGLLAQLLMYKGKNRVRDGLVKGAVTAAVVGVSLVVVSVDPVGITKWKPDAKDVESVVISDDLYLVEEMLSWSDYLQFTQTEDIERILDLHGSLIEEGINRVSVFNMNDYGAIHISYHLKDGTTRVREYYYPLHSDIGRAAQAYWTDPKFLLGYEDWDAFLEEGITAYVEYSAEDSSQYMSWNLDEKQTRGLLAALRADCKSSVLTEAEYSEIFISLNNGKAFYITPKCRNTTAWLKENFPMIYEN